MIDHLDHLVLTTAKEVACIDFYTRVLGMQLESFIGGTPPVERKAFRFGNQKMNLRRISQHRDLWIYVLSLIDH
jgi:catechol 2,3-dioxygenase-like lactoylglutathione lyase family enzyme